MKQRKGFVSNSSSSSFIVGFPKRPESVDEVQELLFGDNLVLAMPDIPAEEAAAIVFERIGSQEEWGDEDAIVQEISEGYFEGYPEHDYIPNMSMDEWDIREQETRAAAKRLWDSRKDEFDNRYILRFEFGESVLEHGDLFRRLPYIRISHH